MWRQEGAAKLYLQHRGVQRGAAFLLAMSAEEKSHSILPQLCAREPPAECSNSTDCVLTTSGDLQSIYGHVRRNGPSKITLDSKTHPKWELSWFPRAEASPGTS